MTIHVERIIRRTTTKLTHMNMTVKNKCIPFEREREGERGDGEERVKEKDYSVLLFSNNREIFSQYTKV